jgi:hypothetical protein
LRNRPILTGTYLRATLFNKVMPRMRNQPEAVGRMIRRRRAARERRHDKLGYAIESIKDLHTERVFERSLRKYGIEPVFEDISSWGKQIQLHITGTFLTMTYQRLLYELGLKI